MSSLIETSSSLDTSATEQNSKGLPTGNAGVGLVEVSDEEHPRTGGDGQGLEPLYADPIVQANKPHGGYRNHGFDTYHLVRFTDTDLVQWYGRSRSGYFNPYGNLMRITPKGLAALSSVSAQVGTPSSETRQTE